MAKRLRFLLLLAAAPWATAHDGPRARTEVSSPDVAGVERVLHALDDAARGCHRPDLQEPLSWQDYFMSGPRCEEIMAADIPARLRALMHIPIRVLPAHRELGEWWPVCSIYVMRGVQDQLMGMDPVLMPANYNSYWKQQSDLCRPPEAVALILNRYDPRYVPPVRGTVTAPLRRERQVQVEGRLRELRQSESQRCCAGDELCREAVAATRFEWCQPPTDPTARDQCQTASYHGVDSAHDLELGAWYGAEYHSRRVLPQAPATFPVRSGYIRLSPYDFKYSDESWEYVLAHELGHACSHVRRQIMARRSAEEAQAFWDYFGRYVEGDSSIGCALNEVARRTYRELFASVGLNNESIQCLEQTAYAAERTRFPPHVLCGGGCPRSYLEETYAEVMALLSMPADRRFLDRVCTGARDGQHPLGADTLRCLMHTPAVSAHIRRAACSDMGWWYL